MLLLYDQIHYLVPSKTVPFLDGNGQTRHLLIPQEWKSIGFQFQHFEPDEITSRVMEQAALADAARPSFASIIHSIPATERLYTWQVANADADLGRGASLHLTPEEEVYAHALLLNKFLIAADIIDAVPITGKSYIHSLVTEKYRLAQAASPDSPSIPSILNPAIAPISLRIIQAVVQDQELEQRSELEIMEYKASHLSLFESFSYTTRKLIKQVASLPGSRDFDRQVADLLATEVWRDKAEIEREIQAAWSAFFRSAVKSAVAGAVTLGITPFFSLGHLSLIPALTAAAAVAPWASSEIINILEKRNQAKQHGLYYLMNFHS